MVGIDLFSNKRKEIFNNKKIINRFFFNEEINLINQVTDKNSLAAKIFACKEAVYKLLHNLYPDLYFNKFAIKVSYVNYVFKISYVAQKNEIINQTIKNINFNNIYISDADEAEYIVVIAMYNNM